MATRLPRGFGVLYRHFGAPDRYQVAHGIARVCQRRGLVLLVAADPQLAADVGADGVHWPFRLRGEARRWRGRFSVQTVSAHSGRELRAVRALPVDAVLLSTVFASRSASAGRAMGALKFRQMAGRTDLALYALGGVTSETAGRLAGAAGLAAVEGLMPFAPEIRT